jgi:hypothetical protein
MRTCLASVTGSFPYVVAGSIRKKGEMLEATGISGGEGIDIEVIRRDEMRR